MQRRISLVRQMLESCDFVGLQETHSTPERVSGLAATFNSHEMYWSHSSCRQGGLGLIVSKAFLAKFSTCSWVEIQSGRIAKLQLRGRHGELDIFICYLCPHSKTDRAVSFRLLSQNVKPSGQTLSVVMGDFNVVTSNHDRWCKTSGAYIGARDSAEAKLFDETVLRPFGLHEWSQDVHTFEGGRALARLDRVYINQHSCDQLDRSCECSVLQFPHAISDHRPVAFARRRPRKPAHSVRPLQVWTLEDPSWSQRVRALHERLVANNRETRSFHQLRLLKQAMRQISSEICREQVQRIASSAEERLSCTMSFLRSALQGHTVGTLQCAARYPFLGEIADATDPFLRLSPSLQAVRSHAVELANVDVMARIAELNAIRASLPEHVYSCRKKHILIRLKRLLPGHVAPLSAIEDPLSGRVQTEPGQMAHLLSSHWGKVFSPKRVNHTLLSQWLQEVQPLPPEHDNDGSFLLRAHHVKTALSQAKESAPGPDGIPYKAYKLLGSYAASYLLDASEDLMESGPIGEPAPDFNHAYLSCLPKKASRMDAVHGAVFSPSDTRPLSIVNTDNRLIAGAYRVLLEPVFNKWVSPMQRGFLSGRSMLANIADVSHEAMMASLQRSNAALFLFDFEAAFPSVAHEYLWATLLHLGLPAPMVAGIQKLYADNRHTLRVKGESFPSFTTGSGVRQGCPLSPLLFAVVADVLLRKLQHCFPDSTVRAFADDTAMISANVCRDGAAIKHVFVEFERISGLRLSVPKTVLMPLWDTSIAQVKRTILRDELICWRHASVSFKAKCLGFMIGPEAGSEGWDKAL